ncbi:leucine--tRNA ligase [Candidatus Peregrinibacteria bacterium]|nr:leucine--tRNA ligase [Candidatus Peregrinibacteria bacterium]
MYEPSSVEGKWQKKWEEAKTYEIDLKNAKDPFYSMVMFPYPSGDKLHVGHWYNFAPADSFARYMRMKGHDVFTPMGFDAFGLPAENYAIKTGVHPDDSITTNVETMITQLKRIGTIYDWSKMVNTSKPDYYQWTQWLFLQMFKNDLAFKKEASVNWCESCQTVLANEQAQDGTCERCDTEVIQKPMTQWYWKISDYSQRLLDGHDNLDWPEKTISMQKNWIGKSEGCDVTWKVEGSDLSLDTFTTTVDTIYGVTFAVISPEHPELENIVTAEHKDAVAAYQNKAIKKTDIDRMAEGKKKTGVDTGAFLIHPFTGEKVPLWVADYVLMNYGTGVVMGVPAHDQRDLDFATSYGFSIVQSIQSDTGETFVYDDVDKYNVKGEIVESGDFTGMSILDGRKKITEALEAKQLGTAKVQFKLRDWSISRQRYWGAPIPIVYDPEGNAHAIPEEHLPWELPRDVEFKPTGTSPLAQSKELKERTEKIFGAGWTPEVDTMDTFVCSSFYQFRYLAEGSDTEFVPKDIAKKWMPADMYIGGPEHACMHLIYSRFVTMALKDFGFIDTEEPFKRLVHQGLITNGGAKMSKSKGNVVSPDAFIEKYGSDTFRMYLMFMGPFTDGGDWNDTGINGTDRFVKRLWRLFDEFKFSPNGREEKEVTSKLHATIKKVTNDMERLQFNTSISALMELLNLLEKAEKIDEDTAKTMIKLLAPLAPHLAEEVWEKLSGDGFVIDQDWPTYDEALLVSDTLTIAVQVNGKLRGTISVDATASKEDIISQAKADPNVSKFTDGADIKKEIYVPGKLVSLVI